MKRRTLMPISIFEWPCRPIQYARAWRMRNDRPACTQCFVSPSVSHPAPRLYRSEQSTSTQIFQSRDTTTKTPKQTSSGHCQLPSKMPRKTPRENDFEIQLFKTLYPKVDPKPPARLLDLRKCTASKRSMYVSTFLKGPESFYLPMRAVMLTLISLQLQCK